MAGVHAEDIAKGVLSFLVNVLIFVVVYDINDTQM